MPQSEQKWWYLVAEAEPVNHKNDVFFHIIVCCTSREEISGLQNLERLRHDTNQQWKQLTYLFIS